jgi:hypothetical protein
MIGPFLDLESELCFWAFFVFTEPNPKEAWARGDLAHASHRLENCSQSLQRPNVTDYFERFLTAPTPTPTKPSAIRSTEAGSGTLGAFVAARKKLS